MGDGTFLELNGFHADGTTKPKVVLTSAYTRLLPADNEFLIRRKVNGFWQLEYAPLSVSISGDTMVDSQVLSYQKSLEYVSGNNGDYLQLYKMDDIGEPAEHVDLKFAKNSFQHLLPDDEEFVIRTRAGGEIQYKKVAVCLSAYLSGDTAPISGDNEKTLAQKSIDLIFDGNDPDYYQLHDMDKVGISLPQKAITLSADGYTPLLPSDYEFVLRYNGAGGTIKYANLSCGIPTLSGDANISQTYQSIQTKEDNDGNKYHEIYNFDTGIVSTYQDTVRFRDPDYTLSSEPGLGCGAQFLVRRPNENGGYSISYEKMIPLQQHERLDYEQQDARGKSIDYTLYDRG